MIAKTIGLAALAGLVMMMPLAAAQSEAGTDEQNETYDAPKEEADPTRGPEGCENCRGGEGEVEDGGNAWAENCPPDMMCAYSDGNASGEPIPYGEEDCIACSGPPVDEGETCMDGSGTDCRDDVQYMTPPGGEGEEASPTSAPASGSGGDSVTSAPEDGAKSVPALGLVALVGAMGAAVALVGRRRA